jgi:hypothetical protein
MGKRGRPKGTTKELKRDKQVRVRLTDAEEKQLKAVAIQKGYGTISDLVRVELLGATPGAIVPGSRENET